MHKMKQKKFEAKKAFCFVLCIRCVAAE